MSVRVRSRGLLLLFIVILCFSSAITEDVKMKLRDACDQLEETIKEASTETEDILTEFDDLQRKLNESQQEQTADATIQFDPETAQAAADLLNMDVQELMDDGEVLFQKLKEINAKLENAGVQAFGNLDMEGSEKSWKAEDGSWSIEQLKADLQACSDELNAKNSTNQEEEKDDNERKVQLRDQKGEEVVKDNSGIEDAKNDVCEPCKKLDEALDDLDKEGEELFRKLHELNPYVERKVYMRGGKWRIDILKYDIEACSQEENECDGDVCSLKQDSEDDQQDSHKEAKEATGDELYDELLQLNAELEEKGVKAFGEIEKGSYFSNGKWNLEILKEDLAMCRDELALREEEADQSSNSDALNKESSDRVKKFAKILQESASTQGEAAKQEKPMKVKLRA